MKTKTKRRKYNKKIAPRKKRIFLWRPFFWPLTANLLWPMKSIYFLFFSLRAIPFLFLFILLFYALGSFLLPFFLINFCFPTYFFRYVSSFCLYVILFIPIYVFNPFFFSINFTIFLLSD